jgi:hypothetical protein
MTLIDASMQVAEFRCQELFLTMSREKERERERERFCELVDAVEGCRQRPLPCPRDPAVRILTSMHLNSDSFPQVLLTLLRCPWTLV